MTTDDNFPLHAFALLPPLQETSECANEADVRAADVSAVGMVASRAAEDTWKRGNADDSMLVLKFNLAHTELRCDIEALYDTIETMEEENAMLMRENEELKKQRDQARAEMKDATVKIQRCGDDLRREMVLLSEKLCETERQKTRITCELEQLRIILKENERVNAQLRAVMGEMETECARLRARTSKEGVLELEAEMNDLIAGWSTKERQINENMGHVQKATLSLKTVADDVQGQLQALEDELRVTEREYKEYREYIADHRCAQGESSELKIAAPRIDHLGHVMPVDSSLLALQTRYAVLEAKYTDNETRTQALIVEAASLRDTVTKHKDLLVKYEASAAAGTETIADLQESLGRLCDQVAQETELRLKSHQEFVQSSHAAEQKYMEQVNVLQTKIEELEAARARPLTPELVDRATTFEGERRETTAHVDSLCARRPDEKTDASQMPIERSSTLVIQPSAQSEVSEDIDDADEEKEMANRQTDAGKGRSFMPPPPRQANSTCGVCQEEPFGFMVRCQKCRNPFHAGCVKNQASGGKKRMGHIFKCSECAPHRPIKIARVKTPTSKPVNPLPSRTNPLPVQPQRPPTQR